MRTPSPATLRLLARFALILLGLVVWLCALLLLLEMTRQLLDTLRFIVELGGMQ